MKPLALLITLLAPPAPAQDSCGLNVTLQSVSSSDAPGDAGSIFPAVSHDGSRVAFVSTASNLVAGDTNARNDVFLRDIAAGTTERVNVSTAGLQANDHTSEVAMSGDGLVVAFASLATNMVAGDTNSQADVFVRDLVAGTTERVSVPMTGVTNSNGASSQPALSYDGRYVAFTSLASNIVNGDGNSAKDVFVHDRVTGTTTRVSVTSTGAEGSNDSRRPVLAGGGLFVFFESFNDLCQNVSPTVRQIYRHDRATGVTECVSLSNSGHPSRRFVGDPSASADGRYVSFRTRASHLTDDTPQWGSRKLYVRDLLTGRTTREDRALDAFAQWNTYDANLSADGSAIVFGTASSNLLPTTGGSGQQLYVRSRDLGYLCRASNTPDGHAASGWSTTNSISGDGARVVYQSYASDLVPNDGPGWDVFAADLRLGAGEVICGGDGRFGDCPCANVGSRGEGCENSTRMGARLDISGTANLDDDDMAFHASHLPPNEPALLFAGTPGAAQPFGDGFLCISGPVTRIGVDQANNHGEATWGDGMLGDAGAEFTVPIAFQAWYRDPSGPCGGGFNLTQAVKILPEL